GDRAVVSTVARSLLERCRRARRTGGELLSAVPGVSCISVAAANLFQHRLRLLAALAGIAVALFLLVLQISVLDAAKAKVTMLYDDFNFDLAAVPDTYQFLLNFETVDRVVLNQARATGDVAQAFGL